MWNSRDHAISNFSTKALSSRNPTKHVHIFIASILKKIYKGTRTSTDLTSGYNLTRQQRFPTRSLKRKNNEDPWRSHSWQTELHIYLLEDCCSSLEEQKERVNLSKSMLPMFNPADRSDYECSVYGITLRRFLEDAVSGKYYSVYCYQTNIKIQRTIQVCKIYISLILITILYSSRSWVKRS